MDPFLLASGSAFWLGVLTSISPCPLATNVAAISFIGKRLGSPRYVLASGLLYTAGRTLAYAALAWAIVASMLSVSHLSQFLQTTFNQFLGPILILVGMVLADLLTFNIKGFGLSESMQKKVERRGIWGAGILGVLFALSFCPISAALYFGGVVPLAVTHGSSIVLPCLYGIGTGLPVIGFAFVLAFGANALGKTFERLTQIEWWVRRLTGGIFVLVGIYLCLVYIFGLSI